MRTAFSKNNISAPSLYKTLNIYFFYSLFYRINLIKKHYEDIFILALILFISFLLIVLIKNSNAVEIMTSVVSSIGTSGLSSYNPPKNYNLFFIFLTISLIPILYVVQAGLQF